MNKYVCLLVEGEIDEIVGSKLLNQYGLIKSVTYGKEGFGYIKNKINEFNKSIAVSSVLLVLVDFMDTGHNCVVEARDDLVMYPNKGLVLRIAVKEIESWLLADRVNIAKFLRVARSRIPRDPESVADPKQKLINIVRHSNSASIRRAILPATRTGQVQGPGYNLKMKEFVANLWSVNAAAENSTSLHRARKDLQRIARLIVTE